MNAQITQNIKQIMPILFVGHGTPMNALQDNQFTKIWKLLGKSINKPKAILCISAHWETNGIAVTAVDKPQTIHDFGGFPKKLNQYEYLVPGSPQLAQKIANNLKQFKVKLDYKWGLDHGSWSILCQMYPNGDIPVLQLSLNEQFNTKQHYQFAKNLKWLRKEGVLILGSGNIIHNLGLIDWQNQKSGHKWAIKMRQQSNEYLLNHQHDKLINYKLNGEQWIKAINSAEHYLPLLYIIALEEEGEMISLFNDQLGMGSLSMTSFIIDDKNSKIHTIIKETKNKNQEL